LLSTRSPPTIYLMSTTKKPDEAIRDLLRTEFGMKDAELRRLSSAEARSELFYRQTDREARR